ncbi:hypothetical protein, partial [Streptomyces sp. NPDC006334]|uniref:hypothetical protein n=1 Tax=Streptomyces sp. NPDC006334 TaxID=3156754 RepID=UPI0033A4CD41
KTARVLVPAPGAQSAADHHGVVRRHARRGPGRAETSAVGPSPRRTSATASAILAVDPFAGHLLRPARLLFRQPANTLAADAEGLSSVADRPPGRADRPMVRGARSDQA